MFGYIKINNDELKGKHLRLYKEYYCALCTQLKKEFGNIYRMLTSYDITFFLIIFDYLSNDKVEIPIKCPLHRKKNKIVYISKKAMDYSILINLFWTIEKLNDDINDEKKIIYRLLKRIIKNNKKVKEKYSNNELLKNWENKLKEYYISENNNESFDILTNIIGEAYGTVFENYITYANIEFDKKAAYELGYLLGKYIYIMDAFDDYFDDIKKSRFNPISKIYEYNQIKDSIDILCIRIKSIISFVVQGIDNIFNRSFVNDNETYYIIENIVHYGLIDKLIAISNQKYVKGNKNGTNI